MIFVVDKGEMWQGGADCFSRQISPLSAQGCFLPPNRRSRHR